MLPHQCRLCCEKFPANGEQRGSGYTPTPTPTSSPNLVSIHRKGARMQRLFLSTKDCSSPQCCPITLLLCTTTLMSVLLCHLPVTYNLLSCHPLSYTISCHVTFCPIQSPVMSASYHVTLLSCTISCMSPSCQVQSPVLSPSVIDNLLLCHPPVIYNLLLCHLLSCTIYCHVTLLSHHPPVMYNLLLCHPL